MDGKTALAGSGGKWKNCEVIFDEGPDGTSFVWGIYGNQTTPSLGMRWNLSEGVGNLGFPNTFGKPNWVVIPDCIARSSLVALLAHICHVDDDKRILWEPRIRKALIECDGGRQDV